MKVLIFLIVMGKVDAFATTPNTANATFHSYLSCFVPWFEDHGNVELQNPTHMAAMRVDIDPRSFWRHQAGGLIITQTGFANVTRVTAQGEYVPYVFPPVGITRDGLNPFIEGNARINMSMFRRDAENGDSEFSAFAFEGVSPKEKIHCPKDGAASTLNSFYYHADTDGFTWGPYLGTYLHADGTACLDFVAAAIESYCPKPHFTRWHDARVLDGSLIFP